MTEFSTACSLSGDTSAGTFSIITLGCRVNQCESDEIAQGMQERGWRNADVGEIAQIVIVNTCTVTGESDRKSRQMIRRAAAQGSHVIVTGCFAQISGEAAARIPGVIYVCGNDRKAKIPEILSHVDMLCAETHTVVETDDISNAKIDPVVFRTPKRVRAYIKIEDGCENRCAYCIIPKARGNVRSKPMDDAVQEAAHLAGFCRELIFTGIETASYGQDLYRGTDKYPYGMALAALLNKVDTLPGVSRIGMGSLEPTVMSPQFVHALTEVKHILHHFHLSIQSGSTSVLRRMRRRYTAEMALSSMERVRQAIPDVTFSADVIVGFPGETEEEFAETVAFCKRARFLHLHLFPYSIREGTEAATMPGQLSEAEKKERLRILDEIQGALRREMLLKYVRDHMQEPVWVLVEKLENNIAHGHTEHFVEVYIPVENDISPVGQLLPVWLTETDGIVCTGTFSAPIP